MKEGSGGGFAAQHLLDLVHAPQQVAELLGARAVFFCFAPQPAHCETYLYSSPFSRGSDAGRGPWPAVGILPMLLFGASGADSSWRGVDVTKLLSADVCMSLRSS